METPKDTERMYHVYSDGMRTDSLFTDDAAFVAGMNAVALCSLKCQVRILCFCLMDNHVHFILNGSRRECNDFIIRYKKWYARWCGGLSEEMSIGIKEVDSGDYLRKAIAYVIRNPIAARYPYQPGDYKWSSSGLYFRETNEAPLGYRDISEVGPKQKRHILSTRQEIPDGWTMDASGMIWPGHYVAYQEVNNIYKSIKLYLYFLSATKETDVAETLGMTERVVIPETELRKAAKVISKEMFSNDSLPGLSVTNRLLLAKRLRKQFGSSIKQIARVVHLDAAYLAEMT